MSSYRCYKYCIVPCCTNTSVASAEKLFFCVPMDPAKRKAWTTAMMCDDKKDKNLSSKTSHWCCEDHFSLEDDMENYWQWKLMKDACKKKRLKSDVIPHIFRCQKMNMESTVEGTAAKKRKHIALVNDASNDRSTTCEVNLGVISDDAIPDDLNISVVREDTHFEMPVEVQIKEETAWDDEFIFAGDSFSNNDKVKITNVQSVTSSENLNCVSSEKEINQKESCDSTFYKKPMKIEKREESFGKFVACEMSELRVNPELYLKTQQSILKLLVEAQFEQMSSNNGA